MINADYRQHMIPVDDAIAQLERFSDLARAELDLSATRASASASSTRSETPSPRSSPATTSSSRAFPPAEPVIIAVAGSIPIA